MRDLDKVIEDIGKKTYITKFSDGKHYITLAFSQEEAENNFYDYIKHNMYPEKVKVIELGKS